MLRIVVDDRERNQRLLSILKAEPGISLQYERLLVGDYLFPNLLVERKSLGDFCQSIKEGRLFRQAEDLARSSIRPLIIVEVDRESKSRRCLRIEAIQGAIITLTVLYNIPLIRSISPEDTAKLMLLASRQIEMFGRKNHRWRRPQPEKNTKSMKRKLQLHFLQGFPGIGVERANNLLDRFGTIRKIMNLSSEEFLQMQGFNQKLVTTIIDLLE